MKIHNLGYESLYTASFNVSGVDAVPGVNDFCFGV